MGIKGLWSVLTPYSEKKSLHEIRGETIAVDLSGWVCDSQNVTEYYVQPKLYLRNLFFRTVYLVLADIEPIFILEGDAPDLKRDVMAARNAIQFRGAAPKSDKAAKKPPDVARKRFKGVLKECENLLRCVGVRCVKGSGEAEATCAQLNAQGLVNAVVSQDSDCFAYGARRVYRNFSVSNSAGGGAMQGSVDCYDADLMFNSNGFGRNKMVALALLCGCDYGIGACGTSINTVVSFLHTVPEKDIIPRLLTWVSDPDYYEKQNCWLQAPGRCDKCGHFGKPHTKNGCPVCVTPKGCNDTGHKAKAAEVKRELSLRNRAMNCGVLFPEPLVMQEFLDKTPDVIDLNNLKKPAPSLIQFVKLMKSKLDWSPRYCVEKFLPLLTKWHLQDNVPVRTIRPVAIKKKRTPRGVPSYEVVWEDIDGHYDALIPDEEFDDDEDNFLPWTSIERQDLMRKYYNNLVETYEESIKKPVKEKKTKAKKTKENAEAVNIINKTNDKPKRKYNKRVRKLVDLEVHNLSESLKNISVSAKAATELNSSRVTVSVSRLKRKIKSAKQKTIDSFIAKKRKSNRTSTRINEKSIMSMSRYNDDYFDNIAHEDYSNDYPVQENDIADIEPVNETNDLKIIDNKENIKLAGLSILEVSDNELPESDLSNIVDKIVTTAPKVKTVKVNSNLVKLVFETKFSTPVKKDRNVLQQINGINCSTPNESPICLKNFKGYKKSISRIEDVKNTSYFFDKLTDNCDAFEMSVNNLGKSVIDCDATLEYSLPFEHSLPDVCI